VELEWGAYTHQYCTIFNEAQCVARLKGFYYSVFTSASSANPYLLFQPPAIQTPALGRTALPAYCIGYKGSIVYRTFHVIIPPTIWRVKLAHGTAEMALQE
jgi:hypothetical protein